MSVRAYVLVEAAIGKVGKVVEALREVPFVVSADAVAGPYDVIVVLEAETAEQVGRTVMDRIHQINGVNYTMTCVAVTRQ